MHLHLQRIRTHLAILLSTVAMSLVPQAHGQSVIDLGWHSFTTPGYAPSGDLGSTLTILNGAMTITSAYGLGGSSLYDPLAATSPGHLGYLDAGDPLLGGLGVLSPGDSLPSVDALGSGGFQQLKFTVNGGAVRMDSFAMVLSGLDFGTSAYNLSGFNLAGADPVMWLDTNFGVFKFNEKEIFAATSFLNDGTLAGAQSGYIDFAAFTSRLDYNTMINSVTLRETNGSFGVSDIYGGNYTGTIPAIPAVPEPSSAALLAITLSMRLIRRRRLSTFHNGLL
jgi:hypothetical protein